MPVKFISIFIFTCFFAFKSLSQSVYDFSYICNNGADSNTYRAFFIRYEDGRGLMRIRYDDPSTAEIVLVEMHLNEHYDSTKSGIEDTTVICYTGSKPDFIYGNSKAIFTKPLFRFALNASTGSFEPFDIRFMDSAGASRQGKLLKADFIKYGEAKDNFLLTFFTKEEEIYQNFRPVINSRSIPARAKNIKMHLLAIEQYLPRIRD